MLRRILERYYQFARWEKQKPRFARLRYLEDWLNGEFYECIPTAFSDEEDGGRLISIMDRRPSVQHNLPQHVADICARKLFGGRHAPRLKHEDPKVRLAIQAFCEELQLIEKMMEIVKRGSVGSVLVLFQFKKEGDKIQSLLEIISPRVVTPVFDQFQELIEARIHYVLSGLDIRMAGFTVDDKGRPINKDQKYWFVRHVNVIEDCIYHPIREQEWNPTEGYVPGTKMYDHLRPLIQAPNPLEFVPAIWIKNLSGGKYPDGKSTFESALNNFIQYDYMDSQMGRGLFYHAAPTMVIKGQIGYSPDQTDIPDEHSAKGQGLLIGPVHAIQLPPDMHDSVGGSTTGHDAKLLDTNAQGISTGVEYGGKLKHTSFEQISVARKDLESISGTMSGKAMELIDQDFLDLIEELRIQYGDNGYLKLLKRLAKAAKFVGHPLVAGLSELQIDGLCLQYPAHYTPDMQEFLYLVQALTLATGQGQKNPEGGVKPADGAPAAPAAPPVKPLLTPEEATEYLKIMMDWTIESEDRPVIAEADETSKDPTPPMPSPDESSPPAGEDEPMDIFSQHPVASETKVPVIKIPY